jgi:hypothetical protein
MIIGINGYSGSGKDAVGKIIQELQPEKNWEIKKFAGKLKTIASILTGIPEEKFEDEDYKKKNLKREWWTTCDEGWQPMTVRELLQKLGTDALRNGLHENVWVNALMQEYRKTTNLKTFMYAKGYTDEREFKKGDTFSGESIMEYMSQTRYPNWIITDVRFSNEARAIKENEGILIRVNRQNVKPINNHPSEISLDGWNFDHVLDNNSDISNLKDNILQILNSSFYESNKPKI